MQVSSNPARVRQLAREGYVAQGGRTFEAARKTGDNFLNAIIAESSDTLEGTVALVAQNACAQHMYHQSAYEGQHVALKALAAGVSGPIGPVLARIAVDGMHQTVWHEASQAYRDGRSMAAVYLDGITRHADDGTERMLAHTARQATNPHLYNQSAFQVQSEGLKRIRDGVRGQDPARTLAAFGRAARMKCLSNPDARAVATPILEAIEGVGDARERAVAETARQAAAAYLHQDVASLAQDVGFAKILEGPKGTLAQDLADFGSRALKNCALAEDQRNLGHQVLRGIARHSGDVGVRDFARVADEVSGQRLYNFSAAGAHYDAFSLIGAGETDLGRLLGRFGLEVLDRGQTVGDSRAMGQGVLEAMGRSTDDPVKRGVIESAVAQGKAATSDMMAVGIQKFAFGWVAKAPTIPPVEGSQDTVDQAVLEQRVGFHESVKALLDEELFTLNGQLSAKQSEMASLADAFNPLVPREHRLIKYQKISRYALYAGIGTALVGGLLSQNAVMVGGMLTCGASVLASSSLNARRQAVLREYWPLRNAYDRLDGEQQALQGAVGATRAMCEPIEQALAADRGRLEVVQLAGGVKPPKAAPAIAVERDMVTIGGVRLKRPSRAPEQAVPAPDGTIQTPGGEAVREAR